MEKRQCEKCKEYHFCEAHHPLPKALFGEGEIVFLCPNCHENYHRYLGKKYLLKQNKQPLEFYFTKWYYWLYVACFAGFVLIISKLLSF